eukprot:jgi/Undpi1/10895/HiC_scaffold_3.g01421.m1
MGPVYRFSQRENGYSNTYTGTYYLESDLYINGGAKLIIDGGETEVDECETLFLASNSSTIVNLRAYGGDLDIRYTKIVSWDLDAGDFDRFPEENGRSHISAISEVITGRVEDTCPDDPSDVNGAAKSDMGIARMDILRSEIAYLGYSGSEAYGISYKARGLCNDLSNLDIFNDYNGPNVHVLGDIHRSELHHNVYNNGNNGIMLHRSCNDGIIANNVVYNNAHAGVAVFETINTHVYGNTLTGNKFLSSDTQEASWNPDGLVKYNQIYANTMTHDEGRVWEINSAEGNVFRDTSPTRTQPFGVIEEGNQQFDLIGNVATRKRS